MNNEKLLFLITILLADYKGINGHRIDKKRANNYYNCMWI